jgi:TPR repeat protein
MLYMNAKSDPISQAVLNMTHCRDEGVPRNYKTAVKQYRLTAKQGNADAQSNLDVMYGTGKGVM